MKKIIVIVTFLLWCMTALALSHKVARGETLESIASKYNITKEQIIEANPGTDKLFYVGLVLNIPEAAEVLEESSIIVTDTPNATDNQSINPETGEVVTSNGFVFFKDGNNIYDYNKKLIIPASKGYESIEFVPSTLFGGFFEVRKGNLYGMCDLAGKEIVPVKHAQIIPSSSGPYFFTFSGLVGLDGKHYYKDDDTWMNFSLQDGFYYYDNKDKLKKLGKLNTKEYFRLRDLATTTLSQTRALPEVNKKTQTKMINDKAVSDNNEQGFIWIKFTDRGRVGVADAYGEIIIPAEFEDVEYFKLNDDLACYKCSKLGSGMQIFTLTGKKFFETLSHGELTFKSDDNIIGYFLLREINRNGNIDFSVYDMSGKKTIYSSKSQKYTDAFFIPDDDGIGFYKVYNDNKQGAVDVYGTTIVKPKKDKTLVYGTKGFYYSGEKYLGITLNPDGTADHSLRLQWDREKKQRRAEMWGNIALAAVAVAGEVLTIQQQAHQAKQYNKSARSSGNNSKRSSTGNNSKRSSTSQLNSNSRNSRSSSPYPLLCTKEEYDKYLSPEAFVYNYTHGLPTLPPSQQTGLTGSDAYAYDIQRNLLHQQQLMDLSAQRETQRLVNDGMQRAQTEIQNFSSIYGREPTPQEMEAIYKGYTQGYIDAYAEYVNETVAASKELGLGSIERTKPNSSNSTDNSSSTGSTSTSTTSKNTSTSSQSKTDKTTSDKDNNIKGNTGNKDKKTGKKDAHEQFKSGNNNVSSSDYGDKIRNVSFYVKDGAKYRKSNTPSQGELYKKGANYYVKVGGTFFKVFNTSGPYNSYIIYGSAAYYF